MNGDVSFLEFGSPESDTSKSLAFFAMLFGWQSHPMANAAGWLQAPRHRVGLHGNDPSLKIHVFFEVANLDAAIDRIRQGGGGVDPLITDEPGFGRFASCQDPLGIQFGLHQPLAP